MSSTQKTPTLEELQADVYRREVRLQVALAAIPTVGTAEHAALLQAVIDEVVSAGS